MYIGFNPDRNSKTHESNNQITLLIKEHNNNVRYSYYAASKKTQTPYK